MLFTVLVIVCHLGIHPVCTKVAEPTLRHYVTYEECSQSARKLVEMIKTTDPQLFLFEVPPPPWNVRGYCMVPVIDEVYIG